MEFIKNLIKRISENYLNFFKNYLISNIFIIISTILAIIFLDTETGLDLFKYEMFFVINTFTIENFFKTKKSRIIGYIIAFIIAIILGYLFNNYEESFENFFIFYVISMSSINLYYIIKKSSLELNNYLHNLFSNLVTTTIINIVLNIGIFAVLSVITVLLIPDYDFDLFLRAEVAILGFYTIPAYLYAFINKETKVTELANVLLKYVIIPLTYIAVLVVYLYIFKIIITNNMPSNSVFGIILALFIECIPIFILFKSLDFKHKFLIFIDNNITFIFLPLYVLQAYAMIIRVMTYGLTKDRYLGLMILFVEAFILFLMKFKKRKYLINIFYVFIACSLITFIIPGINYEDASIYYQKNVVESILKDKKISQLNGEEKAKLVGAYNYLKSENALEKLKIKIDEHEILEENYDYFYKEYNANEDVIDVSKYKQLQQVSYDGTITNGIVKLDIYQIDLSEIINKVINDEELKELIIKLDENHDLYVTTMVISGKNKIADHYSIVGYSLTK